MGSSQAPVGDEERLPVAAASCVVGPFVGNTVAAVDVGKDVGVGLGAGAGVDAAADVATVAVGPGDAAIVFVVG